MLDLHQKHHLEKCLDFCAWLTITPDLYGVSIPIQYLQMSADYVPVGALAANGAGVKNRTVEGYLRSVVQIFAGMRDKDPCLDVLGKI